MLRDVPKILNGTKCEMLNGAKIFFTLSRFLKTKARGPPVKSKKANHRNHRCIGSFGNQNLNVSTDSQCVTEEWRRLHKEVLYDVQGGSNMTGTDFFFVTIIAHHSSNSQTD